MPLVSPIQLDALRAIANKNLDSSAHILRPVEVETDFGSESVFATVELDVPCWIRGTTVPNIIGQEAMRLVTAGTFRCHFEVGTDIEPGDELIVLGERFDVIDTNNENTVKIFSTAMAKRLE